MQNLLLGDSESLDVDAAKRVHSLSRLRPAAAVAVVRLVVNSRSVGPHLPTVAAIDYLVLVNLLPVPCRFCIPDSPVPAPITSFQGRRGGGVSGKLPRALQRRRGPAIPRGVRQPARGPLSERSFPGPQTGSQRACIFFIHHSAHL